MNEGYQESSVDKAQRLSCADLINHHHLVIFRCDDSADYHKAVVFRHDDSAGHHIKSSVGPFRRDDSAGRSQRAKELSSQRNQAQYLHEELNRSHYQLESKAAKEQKNYGLTITKIHEHCNNFTLLNSDESSLQTAGVCYGVVLISGNGVVLKCFRAIVCVVVAAEFSERKEPLFLEILVALDSPCLALTFATHLRRCNCAGSGNAKLLEFEAFEKSLYVSSSASVSFWVSIPDRIELCSCS
ncbi:hypothetical protein F511_29847 [Dorcoceras hygrometricum]|uniref:Uncharacterized protein n=1 Tax=Dorcoceras hygrometricum TaxID=472368 RepID=A0A2Z7D2Z6_9LAMI|nr:hypothetical protein F511_29847 [Dorcoceras hygrometricum]